MVVSKKGKAKLKGKIKGTTTKSKSTKKGKNAVAKSKSSVTVNIDNRKKTNPRKTTTNQANPFYRGGLASGYGGGLGGYGYGSLGMAGFQNPYAQSDLVAQTAQRAVYDALGNRTITGTRAAAQAPSVAEQQAAVQAAALRSDVEPVRPAEPVPLPYPPRGGDPYYEEDVRLAQQQQGAGLRSSRTPAAAARPTLRPILRREQSAESPGGSRIVQQEVREGTFADIREGVGQTRRQNEMSASMWGGYGNETLDKKKTRGAKQGFQGVESNAQVLGSGGGMGLLAKYRAKYKQKKVQPLLYQEADFAEDASIDWDDVRGRGGGAGAKRSVPQLQEGEEDESKVGGARPRGRGERGADRQPRTRRTNFQIAGAELGGLVDASSPRRKPSRASRLKSFLGGGGKSKGDELG